MSEKPETPFDPTSLPSLDPDSPAVPGQAQPSPDGGPKLHDLQPAAGCAGNIQADETLPSNTEPDTQLPDLETVLEKDAANDPEGKTDPEPVATPEPEHEPDPQLPDLDSSTGEAPAASEVDNPNPADTAADAEDEGETDAPSAEAAAEKRALRKKRLITGALIAGAIVAGGVTTYNFIIPAVNYHRADAAFAEGSYAEAQELFTQARTFKDAEKRADESRRGVHYLRGKKAMEQKKHDRAEREFKKAGTFKNADELEQVAHNKFNYETACELQEAKDFTKAGMMFAGIDGYEDARDKAAACASELFKAQSYSSAAEIYDALGDDFKKKGDEARTYDGYLTALIDANEQLHDCDPSGALKTLKPLPKDFAHDKLKVSELRSLCETAQQIAKDCGSFKATTSSEFRVTQTHDSTGIYEYWYNNDTGSSDLTVSYTVNDDNTITVSGTATFYRYTNYSTLSEYLDMTTVTKRFSVKKAKSVPTSIKIDGNTSLTRNGSTWKLKFSERDANSSMHFTYDYTANYTYKK